MRSYSYMDRELNRPRYNGDDRGEFIRDLVFVIMPFISDDSADILTAIRDECTKLGLKAQRVDENIGSGFVIGEITKLIEDAEFIICDLTLERPNVYYELGYAHGVGNEADDILLIAKKGTVLHFDVAPFRVQFYRSTEDLRSIVRTKLKGMIKVTRR